MDIDLIRQNLAGAQLEKTEKQHKDLQEACAGFESMFMNIMIQSMGSTLPGDALFHESNSMNIYKSMYDQSLSDELAKSRTSIGLKQFLYDNLKDSV